VPRANGVSRGACGPSKGNRGFPSSRSPVPNLREFGMGHGINFSHPRLHPFRLGKGAPSERSEPRGHSAVQEHSWVSLVPKSRPEPSGFRDGTRDKLLPPAPPPFPIKIRVPRSRAVGVWEIHLLLPLHCSCGSNCPNPDVSRKAGAEWQGRSKQRPYIVIVKR